MDTLGGRSSNRLKTQLKFVLIGLLTLAIARPGQCGYWKVHFDVAGKSKSRTDENAYWSAFGTNNTRAWNSKNVKMDVNGVWTFAESAGATLYANFLDGGPGASSDVECGGSITPVFTWIPKGDVKDDPPPSEIQFWEKGHVEARRGGGLGIQRFPTYNNTARLSMENAVVDAPDEDGKGMTAELHSSVDNQKRALVVRGATRSMAATGRGETPANKFAGLEQGCGITYSVRMEATLGEAHIMAYKENGQTGNMTSIFPPDGVLASPPNVGDRVWVGMEFKVGHDAHLDSKIKSIKLRLKEENDSQLGDLEHQHSAAENHIDVTLSLRPGDGDAQTLKWQKRTGYFQTDDSGWANTTEALTSSGGSLGSQYRVLWAWDSQVIQKFGGSQLWDHNGLHTISLEAINGQTIDNASSQKIEFLPDDASDQYANPVSKISARSLDIENLVLEKVGAYDINIPEGNPDYFFYDADEQAPEWQRNPEIHFTIKDGGWRAGDTTHYEWKVRIRPTSAEDDSHSILYGDSVTNPGEVTLKPAQMDALEDSPNSSLTYSRPHTFEITVRKLKGSEIEDNGVSYRSKYLSIPTHIDEDINKQGHSVRVERASDHLSILLDYELKTTTIPRSAKQVSADTVWYCDQTLKATKNDLPTGVNTYYEGQEVARTRSLTSKEDALIVILKGEDNYPDQYRDHKSRRIVPKNIISQTYQYHIWYDQIHDYQDRFKSPNIDDGFQMNDMDDANIKKYIIDSMSAIDIKVNFYSSVSDPGSFASGGTDNDGGFPVHGKLNILQQKKATDTNPSGSKCVIISLPPQFAGFASAHPVAQTTNANTEYPPDKPAVAVISAEIFNDGAKIMQDLPIGTSLHSTTSGTVPYWFKWKNSADYNYEIGYLYHDANQDPTHNDAGAYSFIYRLRLASESDRRICRYQYYANVILHELWHVGSEKNNQWHDIKNIDCITYKASNSAFFYNLALSSRKKEGITFDKVKRFGKILYPGIPWRPLYFDEVKRKTVFDNLNEINGVRNEMFYFDPNYYKPDPNGEDEQDQ